MARYFFDFYDGHGDVKRDAHGSECNGYEAVRLQAMQTLPEIAKATIPIDGDKQAFTVSVRNENNITVYTATLTFAGIWLGEYIPHPEEPFI